MSNSLFCLKIKFWWKTEKKRKTICENWDKDDKRTSKADSIKLSINRNQSKWQRSKKAEAKKKEVSRTKYEERGLLCTSRIFHDCKKHSYRNFTLISLSLSSIFLHTVTRWSGRRVHTRKRGKIFISYRPRLRNSSNDDEGKKRSFVSLFFVRKTGSSGIFSPALKYRFGGAHRCVTRLRKKKILSKKERSEKVLWVLFHTKRLGNCRSRCARYRKQIKIKKTLCLNKKKNPFSSFVKKIEFSAVTKAVP